MTAERADQLTDGLAAVLGDARGDVAVRVDGTASVGATRRTLFATVEGPDGETPVVVQLAGLSLDGLSPATEAALVAAARRAGVPAPEVLAADDEPEAVGQPFSVARQVEGLTVPRHVLRAVAADPALGERLTEQLGTALARLHAIDVATIDDGVPRRTDPTPTEAAIAHLRSIAAGLPPSPVVALGVRWLAHHHPAPAPAPTVVHGDLRNGNLIVADAAASEGGLAAIIDWELAHVGDPMEDLAWLCLRCWRFGNDDLPVGGFGHLDDLVDAYEAAGGTFRPDAFAWWEVARTVWWCLVLALQASAFTHGLSDSIVLAASGRRVAELEYDLLHLIDPSRS
ncbi:MAG: phosphotransferase family protein [Acidimicrobiia bacterium]|nr:phosphotransferase family protein [Acidimicrobiia bacterium]